MSEQVIQAVDLTYSYNSLTAVDHINFSVEKGEILGFLGPNGAGKTTTVKMLTGQLVPKEGQAIILGKDMAKNREELQGLIGVCFEEKNLYEKMSAEENLKFFATLFGIRKFDSYPLLKRVGLEKREKDKVEGYSKGMKQRLMMARALVNRPKVLFLDEPTDGLDPVSAEAIRRVILEERDKGATVFLTTHEMMEADKLSDRVAFINEGKITAIDTPENLKQKYGKRALKVRLREKGKVVEKVFPLDEEKIAENIANVFAKEDIVTVHTAEATLEEIFIKITGRGLE
jgi:ABC-2 type transport system ATP-binding protein